MYYNYGYHGYPGYPGYYNFHHTYHPSMSNMGYYNHHHHWNWDPNDNNDNDNYNDNENDNDNDNDNDNENNNSDEYQNNYYEGNYPNYSYYPNYNYNYHHNMYNQEEKESENPMSDYYRRYYNYYHQKEKEKKHDNNKEKQKSENNQKKTNDELILDYENNIRKEIEETTPLVSEDFNINILIDEYKSNEEYIKIIENICKKYKSIRKVRRDGNCFYRCFIYRLFEHICIKNDKELFVKIKQKIIDAKELTGKNGYDWVVVEDFYDIFLKEFTDCFNSLTDKTTVRDYLDALFKDKEKGNYLIYFIRFCIAAYLKEHKEKYQMYIEGSFDNWVRTEVEAIDHEADEIQIMGCVNYFDIGVKIEYLNKNKTEVVKLPEDKPDDQFFIFLLFTPGHYDILYP